MERDDLFQGAVVLARSRRDKEVGRKRSRCTVIRSFQSGASTLTNEVGYLIIADTEDIRPAKITRKALKELGFKEEKTYCSLHRARTSSDGKPYCIQYKYAGPENISVILKGDCSFWDHNMTFGRYGTSEISYIHEVQRVINKINNQR